MYKVKLLNIPMGRNPSWTDYEDLAFGTTLFNTEAEATELMVNTITDCPYLEGRMRVVKCRIRR